jgi:nicotinamide-nucleotide amidase
MAVLAELERAGWTLAVAESLTGGALCSAFVGVPGASRALRGGVTAYVPELKATLLGVDADLLAARGSVDPDVAVAMAVGVRDRLGADVGIATTGVAGPDPLDGHPPGTFHVAVVLPGVTRVRSFHRPGERSAVRAAAVREAVALTLDVLREQGRVPAR